MSGPAPRDCIAEWLASWLRAGLDYEAFWRRTPREIAIILEARVQRVRDRHDAGRLIAHELAQLIAFATHDPKKMPPFRPLAGGGVGGGARGFADQAARADNEVDQARVRAWFIAMALRGEEKE